MRVCAYAKVNLTLQVLGKRADGYHALRSEVAPITLCDYIELSLAPDISSDSEFENDLAVKAACALDRRRGVRIHIEKHIPIGGGLGGGSADAAAVLLALNELWEKNLSLDELSKIGASVGSDVPALIWANARRSCVLMEGRGEIVTPLPKGEPRHLVLLNPNVVSSTRAVYSRCQVHAHDRMNVINDLEPAALELYPEIGEAKRVLCDLGAKDVRMSGSGSTVFGFVTCEEDGRAIVNQATGRGYAAWAAMTLG